MSCIIDPALEISDTKGDLSMYCVRKVTDDLTWVGGSDRRLALFEGVYDVPKGVSYNSYLLTDDKTVLFDTVDHSVDRVFFENIAHVLGEGSWMPGGAAYGAGSCRHHRRGGPPLSWSPDSVQPKDGGYDGAVFLL